MVCGHESHAPFWRPMDCNKFTRIRDPQHDNTVLECREQAEHSLAAGTVLASTLPGESPLPTVAISAASLQAEEARGSLATVAAAAALAASAAKSSPHHDGMPLSHSPPRLHLPAAPRGLPLRLSRPLVPPLHALLSGTPGHLVSELTAATEYSRAAYGYAMAAGHMSSLTRPV